MVMDIEIITQINAAKIDSLRWEKVYYDCLKIARAGKLATVVPYPINGYTIDVIADAMERDNKIQIVGDTLLGVNVKGFEIERDVTKHLQNNADKNADAPVTEHLYSIFRNEKSKYDKIFTTCFGGQTNEKGPYIYLLAMACLIAGEFSEAAVVYGDISYKQCLEACDIAEKAVGRKVNMPIQYNCKKLFEELQKLGYTDDELLEKYLAIYKGIRSEGFKKILKDNFSENQFISYFLQHRHEEIYDDIKNWLEMGLPLDGLCKLCKRIGNISAKELIELLILGKVHIEYKTMRDKNCFINLSAPNATDKDDMRSVFANHFPKDKTDEYFADAVAGKGQLFEDQKTVEALYDFIQITAKKARKIKADIPAPDELYKWKDSDTTIDEAALEAITKSLKAFFRLGQYILDLLLLSTHRTVHYVLIFSVFVYKGLMKCSYK
ncbi:hypothetical protein SAMN02910317_03055 [Ruminococcaceae bacterium FB2012]|nr:hypothetical protein SAMN02910317_03055 [Ruminococcaceae bacterium FB2012]